MLFVELLIFSICRNDASHREIDCTGNNRSLLQFDVKCTFSRDRSGLHLKRFEWASWVAAIQRKLGPFPKGRRAARLAAFGLWLDGVNVYRSKTDSQTAVRLKLLNVLDFIFQRHEESGLRVTTFDSHAYEGDVCTFIQFS